jgi:pyridine nucleotide-disulfide oxidoreductase family protein
LKRLLLAGGGHAHVFVLRELARRRVPGLEITLLTPYDRQLYSGMLPGWIAGHYTLDELTIPLQPLANAAGAQLTLDRLVGLDLLERQVLTERGAAIPFDIVSLATGSSIAVGAIEGVAPFARTLRPTHEFVATWAALAPRLAEAQRPKITVIGAGAGGVEVALAAAHAMKLAGNGAQIQLVTGGALLPGHSVRARSLVATALMREQVRVIDTAATRIASGHVELQNSSPLTTDVTLIASGAAPPPWLQATGLALDKSGFLAVDRQLRSISHEAVFGAGDIASIVDEPRARSGVYAVRAGPPLAENLIRRAQGTALRSYTPQRNALYLLATGPKHAIASWNSLAWQGDWVWRWKDRIDRGFIAAFRTS